MKEIKRAAGFLLIDQKGNTLCLPADSEELAEFFKWFGSKYLKNIKQHGTRTDLLKDIRRYLDGEYEQFKEGE